MKKYDQCVVVENGRLREVNGQTRIYTIEYVKFERVKLFQVPKIRFYEDGTLIPNTNSNNPAWRENNVQLINACALVNKEQYIKENGEKV